MNGQWQGHSLVPQVTERFSRTTILQRAGNGKGNSFARPERNRANNKPISLTGSGKFRLLALRDDSTDFSIMVMQQLNLPP
jgi:hypothetical protein